MRLTNSIHRLVCGLLLLSSGAFAAEVELAGIFGRRAVVVVNGGAPQTLAVGQRTREGVRLVEIRDTSAVIDVDGTHRQVFFGGGPVRMGDASSAQSGSPTMRLASDSRGHYWAQGAVNGASVRFMVDTGATLVAISADEAKRAGVDYRAGRPIQISTANGIITAYLVTLDRISIGGIVLHGVEASVHESGLGVALLGMSFIKRLDMRREADQLVLHKRY